MAASGFVDISEAAVVEMAREHKSPRVHLLQMNAIFAHSFDKNGTSNGSNIAKCLERLNGVLPSATIEPYLKTSLTPKFNGLNFGREAFCSRLGRSPSTDSIAVSNFSSDQGSVDSCHYSSNGSDSNSGSSPCSPEEPDRSSRAGTPQPMPPIPLSLQYESHTDENSLSQINGESGTKENLYDFSRTDDINICSDSGSVFFPKTCSERTSSANDLCTKKEEIKHFYLQNSCLVPNSKSEPFQRAQTVPSLKQTNNISCSFPSDRNSVGKETRGHSEHLFPFAKQNSSQNNFSCISTHQSNCSSTDIQQCNRSQCETYVDGNTELVEHIRSQHVKVQMEKESFVCLWAGCKVYNRASCSLSWLERHVLSHGGSKPFKCIVDNCSQRFPTQAALQRHVNSHFDGQQNSNQAGKTSKCRDEIVTKSFRRRRHHKYKKRNIIGKTEDFFDANIMEQIRYKLVELQSSTSSYDSSHSGFVTFYSRVKARRTEESGKVNVLLHWIPENVLPDSWVSEGSVIKCKKVPYSSLPPESLASLDPLFKCTEDAPRVKRRRK